MWALDSEEMESSSKIDLRDVLWWMSIKNACKPRASLIVRFQKKGASPWLQEENHIAMHVNMTKIEVGPLQPEKHTFPK